MSRNRKVADCNRCLSTVDQSRMVAVNFDLPVSYDYEADVPGLTSANQAAITDTSQGVCGDFCPACWPVIAKELGASILRGRHPKEDGNEACETSTDGPCQRVREIHADLFVYPDGSWAICRHGETTMCATGKEATVLAGQRRVLAVYRSLVSSPGTEPFTSAPTD